MPADLPSLLVSLKSTKTAERLEAAEALMQMGEDAAPAAAALAVAASDQDDEVREAAVGALEGLGMPPASQLNELVKLLHQPPADSSTADTAYWAATLLGRLGSAAAPAVTDLTQVLGPAAPLEVRQQAAWALGKIGRPAIAARPALELAAAHRDERLARLAGEALQAIGAK